MMTVKNNTPEELSQFNWKPYPEQKPSDNDRFADFLVLYKNPHFLKKKLGWEKYHNAPEFIPTIANWLGECFNVNTSVLFYTEITFPENK